MAMVRVVTAGGGKMPAYRFTNDGDSSGNVYGRRQYPADSWGSGRGDDLGYGKGYGAAFPSGCAAGDGDGYGWGAAAGEGDPTGKCSCKILQDDEIP